MPTTNDVEAAVTSILLPFSENNEDCRNSFWDWWVIGGRWSGLKQESLLDPEKLEFFRQWLQDEKITVSGFQAGKPELSPASQIQKVDSKWQDLFGVTTPCSLFQHSSNPFAKNNNFDADILPVSMLNERMTCSTLIVAVPDYVPETEKFEGKLKAGMILHDSIWNGVTHQDTTFDGKVLSGLEQRREYLKNSKDEYRKVAYPTDEWIVVTVDYHS